MGRCSQQSTFVIASNVVEPDNIVLEHLRHIRGVVDGTRDDVRELKHRIGSVERETAHVHVELAQVHVKVAELSERVDRLSDRLERVEKRLELADA